MPRVAQASNQMWMFPVPRAFSYADSGSPFALRRELDLRGDAAHPTPPWPQIGFAMLCMFN